MKKLIFFIFIFAFVLATLNGCKLGTLNDTETGTADAGISDYTYNDFLSNISCDNNTITLTLTNIGNSTWNIAEDVTFYVNNFRDESPGCDKTSLESGELTICSSLDVASLGLTPSLIVVTPFGKEVMKVSC